MYDTRLAKFHAFTTIVGMFGLFFTMGMLGDGTAPGADGVMMMRRYATYTYAPQLQLGHVIATGFALTAGVGQLAFFVNLLWSLRAGDEVTNPWDDLLSGQRMPSPEWDGFPYWPPTPGAISDSTTDRDRAVADGGPTETGGDD
jgi:cytochrome c oxidase subunit 1